MFRKIAALIFALVSLTLLTSSCGSDAESAPAEGTATASQPSVETVDSAVSLDGFWKTSQDSPEMQAIVRNGVIEIFWITDDTQSLYWKGDVPQQVEDGAQFVSKGDVKAMEMSMLASQNETKEFAYTDETLVFELTAMGTTTTVRMTQ